MHEAVASPLVAWQNFYVIIGTAAATLTGLMFVVVTVIAGVQRQLSSLNDGVAAFSTPSVVHFCVSLLVAALLSAPWPELWYAGLLLGLCGIGGMIYIFIVIRRTRRQTAYQPVLEDWLWHTILPLCSYVVFVVSAVMLATDAPLALFIIAAGMVMLLFIGIHNAWDNVTYLIVEYVVSNNAR